VASAGGDCASHVRSAELLSILSSNSATRSFKAEPDGAHAGMKVLLLGKAFEVKAMASRISARTSSRVGPVATHPACPRALITSRIFTPSATRQALEAVR